MKRSTQELVNIKAIKDNTIITYGNYIYAYFKIKESNLSIMSDGNIYDKVINLADVVAGNDNVFFDCLDSKEDLENNKIFYNNRLKSEDNEYIKNNLLKKELEYLNDLEIKHVTRKIFLATLRFPKEISKKEMAFEISRFYNLLESKGLGGEALSHDDLKNIVGIYLERNTTINHYDEVDGSRWLSD